MDPAAEWGLFIREWREGWAGLTRPQLASALSQHTRRPIRPHVVRAWESGQPPGSDDELSALRVVMRARGLAESEVGTVERAICGALVARHYPSLPDASGAIDDMADEDVDRVIVGRPGRDIVRMLAEIRLLTAALEEDTRRARPGRHCRAIRRSLLARKARLAVNEQGVGRFARMETLCREAAGSLRLLEPQGLGSIATATCMEVHAAFARLSRGPCPRAQARLRRLIRECLEAGDALSAAQAYCWSVQFGARLPRGQFDRLLAGWERMLDLARRADPDGRYIAPQWHLLEPHIARQDWAALESLLERLNAHLGPSGDDYLRGLIRLSEGRLESGLGRPQAAAERFEHAAAAGRRAGNLPLVEEAEEALRRCAG